MPLQAQRQGGRRSKRAKLTGAGCVQAASAAPMIYSAFCASHRQRHQPSLARSVSELWLASQGQVAQLVEHVTENHGVGSSILPLATNLRSPVFIRKLPAVA